MVRAVMVRAVSENLVHKTGIDNRVPNEYVIYIGYFFN